MGPEPPMVRSCRARCQRLFRPRLPIQEKVQVSKPAPIEPAPFEPTPVEMVEKQLRQRGIRDQRVLNAMLVIPREEFVSVKDRARAYADGPIPIGYGQTITQPYMTALMAQTLNLEGTEKVLDIGTGSGYHAAVLGRLARRVISVERIPRLVALARANLDRAG